MNHLTEEQLILYYYGEDGGTGEIETHLEACEDCRSALGTLQRVLNVVDSAPVPERGTDYAAEVWQRLQPVLPRRRRWSIRFPAQQWIAAAAMAGLLVLAFLAGRFYPGPRRPATAASAGQVRERILLVAVGDHLERSQMVLIELVNARAKGALDISTEQERAAELVNENRLYRQTAASRGETRLAGVLDELEPILLEIARGPSRVSAEDLEKIRGRIEADGILFKVRVVESNVRQREELAVKNPARRNL